MRFFSARSNFFFHQDGSVEAMAFLMPVYFQGFAINLDKSI